MYPTTSPWDVGMLNIRGWKQRLEGSDEERGIALPINGEVHGFVVDRSGTGDDTVYMVPEEELDHIEAEEGERFDLSA